MDSNPRHMDELLSDFVSGHLAPEQSEELANHLRECADCRSLFGTAKAMADRLSPDRSGANSDHLSDELIWQYYSQDSALSPQANLKVENHLAHCFDCSTALDLLNGLDQDLSKIGHETQKTRVKEGALGTRLVNYLKSPVLAYSLAALALYPAVRWLMAKPEIENASALPPLPSKTYQLHLQMRSGNQQTEVIRSTDKPILCLEVPFYGVAETKSYTVQLSDSHKRSYPHVRSTISVGTNGTVIVILDSSPLSDGQYTLTLVESDKQRSEDLAATDFSFALMTSR